MKPYKPKVLLLFMAALLYQVSIWSEERRELFEFGEFALYANTAVVRGVVLALGGPDTRAFATSKTFGAPTTELEESLHVLGQDIRNLAKSEQLAVLGTVRSALPNEPASDEMLLNALDQAAEVSHHPELVTAPLLMYGISGGTPEASGFTARNYQRVAGLFLKVPAPPERLTNPEALLVPTCMILAERDMLTDNLAQIAAFTANRKAGGLWAMAIEPKVPHHSLTPQHRSITLNWMRAIVQLRLRGNALQNVTESSGWLGGSKVTPWSSFPGDRRSANWFPSKETAEEWKTFIGQKHPH